MGRPEEARAQMDRAVALDPLNGQITAMNGATFMYEHRYEDAIAEWRRAGDVGLPGGPISDVLHLNGADAEAFAQLRIECADDQEVLDALDRGYAEGGFRAANRRVADILADRRTTTSAVWAAPWSVAVWYAFAREKERALEWLERAYEQHDLNMPFIRVDPRFDYVRGDPRFQALLRRMGLRER